MGIEYYIVKPSSQQKFYLGKRISFLQGINMWKYGQKADYCQWENEMNVVTDIYNNCGYFLEQDVRTSQICDFANAIFEFCNAPVYLDDDCSENACNWENYEEIDVYSDILNEKEEWASLITLIPQEKWITKDHIVDEFETVKKFLIEARRTTCQNNVQK